jgi:hypothetical protein
MVHLRELGGTPSLMRRRVLVVREVEMEGVAGLALETEQADER